MKRAIYPGSFDPITNGHIDILKRACDVFDEVIVLIAVNPNKHFNFSPKERVEMIEDAVKEAGLNNVKVDYYEGLTVKYAKDHDAKHLIRGLRAVTDFEYEFQLATANGYVDESIDMVFFMARGDKTFISSSTIMELARCGVDVSNLVPRSVYLKIKK